MRVARRCSCPSFVIGVQDVRIFSLICSFHFYVLLFVFIYFSFIKLPFFLFFFMHSPKSYVHRTCVSIQQWSIIVLSIRLRFMVIRSNLYWVAVGFSHIAQTSKEDGRIIHHIFAANSCGVQTLFREVSNAKTLKSHALRCNLTLSRRHEHFSCIGIFLVGNSTF